MTAELSTTPVKTDVITRVPLYHGAASSVGWTVFSAGMGVAWGAITKTNLLASGIMFGGMTLASCLFAKILDECRDRNFLSEKTVRRLHDLSGPILATIASLTLLALGIFTPVVAVTYIGSSLFLYVAPKILKFVFPRQIAEFQKWHKEKLEESAQYLKDLEVQINARRAAQQQLRV